MPSRFCAISCIGLFASCSLIYQGTNSEPMEDWDARQVVDASPSLTPSFVVLPLSCGETKVVPTNVSVTLGEGEPAVARYRWVLRDPDGTEILESLGSPEHELERSARQLGGTYAAPEFNLTLYRGQKIGLFSRFSGADIPSLLQRFALSEGLYELEAIVGFPESAQVEAHLRNGALDGVSYSEQLTFSCVADSTCGQLQYKRFDFQTNGNLNGTAINGMLQLVFYTAGDYYIDGVRLRHVNTGEDLVQDESFDTGANWTVGNPNSASFAPEPIPDMFAAYGNYTLSLSVIDVEGTVGPIASTTLEQKACP